jgi:hypothetical protein
MARHSRILLAAVLGIACAAEAPVARAGLVTPDSIGSPVVSTASAGTPVAPGGLVTNQYQNLGLLFPFHGPDAAGGYYSAAVVRLNNQDIFTGAYQGITANGLVRLVSQDSAVVAALVLPGTTTPDTADSVTVTFASAGPGLAQLEAFDKNGRLVKTVTAQVGGILDTPVELDVEGIQSVNALVYEPVIDPPPGVVSVAGYRVYAWGVSSIEWHEAPEPAGFVLGGLGMLALLAYALRRRLMRVRLGVRGA